MIRTRYVVAAGLIGLLLVGAVGAIGITGASVGPATGADADVAAGGAVQDEGTNVTVSEDAYVEPAPEPGDPYYEASDGDWVSYVNPRDEYRSPYLGDGSGKICVALFNEAGEPIVGETVPNTTVTVPTGETTSWHSDADPVTVSYPLTEHYERPLDADQFGTTEDLPQGDGYMDAHCIEMHGHPEDATIEYGEARVEGEHADRIEVAGYIQKAHDTWETDVDPIDAAESYDEAGGGWTYQPGGSHGQVVVVLQLDEDVTGAGEVVPNEDEDENATGNGDDSSDETGDSTTGSETSEGDETGGSTTGSETSESDDNDEMPGFGVATAVFALGLALVVARRRLS